MQRAERGSSTYFQAVTPSDTTNVSISVRYIYVGTTGNLNVVPYDGTANVLIMNVPVGYHDFSVRKISNTETTASNIIAFT